LNSKKNMVIGLVGAVALVFLVFVITKQKTSKDQSGKSTGSDQTDLQTDNDGATGRSGGGSVAGREEQSDKSEDTSSTATVPRDSKEESTDINRTKSDSKTSNEEGPSIPVPSRIDSGKSKAEDGIDSKHSKKVTSSEEAKSKKEDASDRGAKGTGALTDAPGAPEKKGETAKAEAPKPPPIDAGASKPKDSCDDQWKSYQKSFQGGSDMVYQTTMASDKPIASNIETSHFEIIKNSAVSRVLRDVVFSSDHPTGTLILTTMGISPSIEVNRGSFINQCNQALGRSVSSVLFRLDGTNLSEIRDEQVKVGVGVYASFRMKGVFNVQIGKKSVRVASEVWMAKNKPGLVVKQNIRIPANVFPEHGTIRISSQLAGGRKI
jgi:hypothetical protein